MKWPSAPPARPFISNKSWFYDEELYRENFQKETTNRVTCPGCQKVQDHYYEGVLTLEGEFLAQHKDDIMALLHRQAEQVAQKNPLERVIQIVPEGNDRLIVETTTEKLAQRLGKGRVPGLQRQPGLPLVAHE